MDHLCASGITDLDNVREPIHKRVMRTFPQLLDVTDYQVSVALLTEAAAASPYGYASPKYCDIVAERWLAAWYAAHPIAA